MSEKCPHCGQRLPTIKDDAWYMSLFLDYTVRSLLIEAEIGKGVFIGDASEACQRLANLHRKPVIWNFNDHPQETKPQL